jgi:hypothetical protein
MLNRRQAVLMQVSLGQLMLRFMGRSSINKRPVGRLSPPERQQIMVRFFPQTPNWPRSIAF